MSRILLGSLAGCFATGPMTASMELLHRKLPQQEQYQLPPREVTMAVADEAGLKPHLDEHRRQELTLLAHFGMGTAMGALYGAFGRHLPLPVPLAGALFGLGVWAGNYLGVLPAANLLGPATEHPPRRTAVMIAAHLVWGVTTSLLMECLEPEDKQQKTDGVSSN